jgi:hypothetical protein
VVPRPMQQHFQVTNNIMNASARYHALTECNRTKRGQAFDPILGLQIEVTRWLIQQQRDCMRQLSCVCVVAHSEFICLPRSNHVAGSEQGSDIEGLHGP